MKKTLVALAAVMMMGGTIACAQQPEKENTAGDKTATEQPASDTKAEKPADGTCSGKCGDQDGQEQSGSSSSATPAGDTATNAM